MNGPLKDTLIRVWSLDMARNYGNVVVAEINPRRVEHMTRDYPGVALLDTGEALEPVARAMANGYSFHVVIAATDELIWTPVRAGLSITGYWTLEMIPFVEHHRSTIVSDSQILREAHAHDD